MPGNKHFKWLKKKKVKELTENKAKGWSREEKCNFVAGVTSVTSEMNKLWKVLTLLSLLFVIRAEVYRMLLHASKWSLNMLYWCRKGKPRGQSKPANAGLSFCGKNIYWKEKIEAGKCDSWEKWTALISQKRKGIWRVLSQTSTGRIMQMKIGRPHSPASITKQG